METYRKKINLGDGKFAYEQTAEAYKLGKLIVEKISKKWSPPSNYFHYQKGGHLAALNVHRNNNCFSKIDLSKFYYKITKNKIIRNLKKIGFTFIEADEIAALSTISHNGYFVLPFGFVQSSIISSLVLSKSAIGEVFRSRPSGINLSVYVDDILVSALNAPALVGFYSQQICSAVEQSNFIINLDKTILAKKELEIFNVKISQNDWKISDVRMSEFMMEMSLTENDNRADAMIKYVSNVNVAQSESLSRMRDMRR